ncbi:CHCH- LETM1-like protein [Parasponia andersonii]|uniref:CHCH-LETM1-like protein n=1 Tax=Parasponia andersonii TaxID=3476 RepID=A0A2P5BDT0_PARAD|nr:CHCH- LETM1-like protein [Parasponia andersonii]
MSAGGAFGGNRGLRPVPPEKGVFPLDHMHLCDLEKKEYLSCLKSFGHQSDKCRSFSKKYLQCRMEKNLMAKQDMSELGFGKETDIEGSEDKDNVCVRLDGYAQKLLCLRLKWLPFPLVFSPFRSFMAFHLSLQITHFYNSKCMRSENKQRKSAKASQASSCKSKEQRSYSLARKNVFFGLLFSCYTSSRRFSSCTTLSFPASAYFAEANSENCDPEAKTQCDEIEFNRVDCLLWVLHESARSFSLAVESLKLTGTGPELAMAWVGKDVHEWHKRISYLVAVYALLKTAIEVEVLLSRERHYNKLCPVNDILTPKINLVGEYIENQLNTRHSKLGEWFRVVELPRVAAFFIPLLKKWSMEYAGSLNTEVFSGVAGMVVAISCCAAVGKLGSGRTTCPLFTLSTEDVMIEFMDLAHCLVSVEKLHQLATEAGFELDFLSHFGTKVLQSKKSEELEFWIGLAQKKLSIAFHKEMVISTGRTFPDKVQADTLATLGLFAYLGRRTRLFLSKMGIKDLDEPVRDLLSYLECGSIFIYQEFSYISMYQSFMEVVTGEIGWLDFYASFPSVCSQERQRSKQHALQAETEIVLSTVFATCYDVVSGFAHFSRSTQQLLDTDLLSFLLQSQTLLAFCLEDTWAVYGKSSVHDPALSSVKAIGTTKASLIMESQQNPNDFIMAGRPNKEFQHDFKLRKVNGSLETGTRTVNPTEESSTAKLNPIHKSLLKKYSIKLASASSDVWMGTWLLFVDIMIALELFFKQLRGYKVTRRERHTLKRTLNDIASLVPVTILMLLPVSAVGHAAILAAIKKYMPSMIPSPYSSERLDVVKQLKRTKKMEVRIRSNPEDPSSKIS